LFSSGWASCVSGGAAALSRLFPDPAAAADSSRKDVESLVRLAAQPLRALSAISLGTHPQALSWCDSGAEVTTEAFFAPGAKRLGVADWEANAETEL